jgi:hypothetical protein
MRSRRWLSVKSATSYLPLANILKHALFNADRAWLNHWTSCFDARYGSRLAGPLERVSAAAIASVLILISASYYSC